MKKLRLDKIDENEVFEKAILTISRFAKIQLTCKDLTEISYSIEVLNRIFKFAILVFLIFNSFLESKQRKTATFSKKAPL